MITSSSQAKDIVSPATLASQIAYDLLRHFERHVRSRVEKFSRLTTVLPGSNYLRETAIQLSLDYCFYMALEAILRTCDSTSLSRVDLMQLDRFFLNTCEAFAKFNYSKKGHVEYYISHLALHEQFARVLGSYNRHSPLIVGDLLRRQIDDIRRSNYMHTSLYLLNLTFIHFSLETQEDIMHSVRHLSLLHDSMKRARDRVTKHTLANVMLHILLPTVYAPRNPDLDYHHWDNGLIDVYQYALHWGRKHKHLTAVIPLCGVILSASKHDLVLVHFLSYFALLAECMKFEYLTIIILDSLIHTIHAFLVRSLEQGNSAFVEQTISLLASLVFHRPINDDHFTIFYVQFILSIACTHLQPATLIILDLLTRNSPFSEHVLIGLSALQALTTTYQKTDLFSFEQKFPTGAPCVIPVFPSPVLPLPSIIHSLEHHRSCAVTFEYASINKNLIQTSHHYFRRQLSYTTDDILTFLHFRPLPVDQETDIVFVNEFKSSNASPETLTLSDYFSSPLNLANHPGHAHQQFRYSIPASVYDSLVYLPPITSALITLHHSRVHKGAFMTELSPPKSTRFLNVLQPSMPFNIQKFTGMLITAPFTRTGSGLTDTTQIDTSKKGIGEMMKSHFTLPLKRTQSEKLSNSNGYIWLTTSHVNDAIDSAISSPHISQQSSLSRHQLIQGSESGISSITLLPHNTSYTPGWLLRAFDQHPLNWDQTEFRAASLPMRIHPLAVIQSFYSNHRQPLPFLSAFYLGTGKAPVLPPTAFDKHTDKTTISTLNKTTPQVFREMAERCEELINDQGSDRHGREAYSFYSSSIPSQSPSTQLNLDATPSVELAKSRSFLLTYPRNNSATISVTNNHVILASFLLTNETQLSDHLTTLRKEIQNLLLNRTHTNPIRASSVGRDKQNGIPSLGLLIQLLSLFKMNRAQSTVFVDTLLTSFIHINPSIQSAAGRTITKLFRRSPPTRPIIMVKLGQHLIGITDSFPQLLVLYLQKMISLVEEWIEIALKGELPHNQFLESISLINSRKRPNQTPSVQSHLNIIDESEDQNLLYTDAFSTHAELLSHLPLHDIESIGLSMFCSTETQIRQLSLHLLESVSSLYRVLCTLSHIPPHPTVWGVIDSQQQIIVNQAVTYADPWSHTPSTSSVSFHDLVVSGSLPPTKSTAFEQLLVRGSVSTCEKGGMGRGVNAGPDCVMAVMMASPRKDEILSEIIGHVASLVDTDCSRSATQAWLLINDRLSLGFTTGSKSFTQLKPEALWKLTCWRHYSAFLLACNPFDHKHEPRQPPSDSKHSHETIITSLNRLFQASNDFQHRAAVTSLHNLHRSLIPLFLDQFDSYLSEPLNPKLAEDYAFHVRNICTTTSLVISLLKQHPQILIERDHRTTVEKFTGFFSRVELLIIGWIQCQNTPLPCLQFIQRWTAYFVMATNLLIFTQMTFQHALSSGSLLDVSNIGSNARSPTLTENVNEKPTSLEYGMFDSMSLNSTCCTPPLSCFIPNSPSPAILASPFTPRSQNRGLSGISLVQSAAPPAPPLPPTEEHSPTSQMSKVLSILNPGQSKENPPLLTSSVVGPIHYLTSPLPQPPESMERMALELFQTTLDSVVVGTQEMDSDGTVIPIHNNIIFPFLRSQGLSKLLSGAQRVGKKATLVTAHMPTLPDSLKQALIFPSGSGTEYSIQSPLYNNQISSSFPSALVVSQLVNLTRRDVKGSRVGHTHNGFIEQPLSNISDIADGLPFLPSSDNGDTSLDPSVEVGVNMYGLPNVLTTNPELLYPHQSQSDLAKQRDFLSSLTRADNPASRMYANAVLSIPSQLTLTCYILNGITTHFDLATDLDVATLAFKDGPEAVAQTIVSSSILPPIDASGDQPFSPAHRFRLFCMFMLFPNAFGTFPELKDSIQAIVMQSEERTVYNALFAHLLLNFNELCVSVSAQLLDGPLFHDKAFISTKAEFSSLQHHRNERVDEADLFKPRDLPGSPIEPLVTRTAQNRTKLNNPLSVVSLSTEDSVFLSVYNSSDMKEEQTIESELKYTISRTLANLSIVSKNKTSLQFSPLNHLYPLIGATMPPFSVVAWFSSLPSRTLPHYYSHQLPPHLSISSSKSVPQSWNPSTITSTTVSSQSLSELSQPVSLFQRYQGNLYTAAGLISSHHGEFTSDSDIASLKPGFYHGSLFIQSNDQFMNQNLHYTTPAPPIVHVTPPFQFLLPIVHQANSYSMIPFTDKLAKTQPFPASLPRLLNAIVGANQFDPTLAGAIDRISLMSRHSLFLFLEEKESLADRVPKQRSYRSSFPGARIPPTAAGGGMAIRYQRVMPEMPMTSQHVERINNQDGSITNNFTLNSQLATSHSSSVDSLQFYPGLRAGHSTESPDRPSTHPIHFTHTLHNTMVTQMDDPLLPPVAEVFPSMTLEAQPLGVSEEVVTHLLSQVPNSLSKNLTDMNGGIVLWWINKCFSSPFESTRRQGSIALKNVLSANPQRSSVSVNQCFSRSVSDGIDEAHFEVLYDLYWEDKLEVPPPTLIILSLYLLTHSNPTTRLAAARMSASLFRRYVTDIQGLKEDMNPRDVAITDLCESLELSLNNPSDLLPDLQLLQRSVMETYALLHPEMSPLFVRTLVQQFSTVPTVHGLKTLFNLLIPHTRNVNFDSPFMYPMLKSLIDLTFEHISTCREMLEEVWTTLCEDAAVVEALVSLLYLCLSQDSFDLGSTPNQSKGLSYREPYFLPVILSSISNRSNFPKVLDQQSPFQSPIGGTSPGQNFTFKFDSADGEKNWRHSIHHHYYAKSTQSTLSMAASKLGTSQLLSHPRSVSEFNPSLPPLITDKGNESETIPTTQSEQPKPQRAPHNWSTLKPPPSLTLSVNSFSPLSLQAAASTPPFSSYLFRTQTDLNRVQQPNPSPNATTPGHFTDPAYNSLFASISFIIIVCSKFHPELVCRVYYEWAQHPSQVVSRYMSEQLKKTQTRVKKKNNVDSLLGFVNSSENYLTRHILMIDMGKLLRGIGIPFNPSYVENSTTLASESLGSTGIESGKGSDHFPSPLTPDSPTHPGPTMSRSGPTKLRVSALSVDIQNEKDQHESDMKTIEVILATFVHSLSTATMATLRTSPSAIIIAQSIPLQAIVLFHYIFNDITNTTTIENFSVFNYFPDTIELRLNLLGVKGISYISWILLRGSSPLEAVTRLFQQILDMPNVHESARVMIRRYFEQTNPMPPSDIPLFLRVEKMMNKMGGRRPKVLHPLINSSSLCYLHGSHIYRTPIPSNSHSILLKASSNPATFSIYSQLYVSFSRALAHRCPPWWPKLMISLKQSLDSTETARHPEVKHLPSPSAQPTQTSSHAIVMTEPDGPPMLNKDGLMMLVAASTQLITSDQLGVVIGLVQSVISRLNVEFLEIASETITNPGGEYRPSHSLTNSFLIVDAVLKYAASRTRNPKVLAKLFSKTKSKLRRTKMFGDYQSWSGRPTRGWSKRIDTLYNKTVHVGSDKHRRFLRKHYVQQKNAFITQAKLKMSDPPVSIKNTIKSIRAAKQDNFTLNIHSVSSEFDISTSQATGRRHLQYDRSSFASLSLEQTQSSDTFDSVISPKRRSPQFIRHRQSASALSRHRGVVPNLNLMDVGRSSSVAFRRVSLPLVEIAVNAKIHRTINIIQAFRALISIFLHSPIHKSYEEVYKHIKAMQIGGYSRPPRPTTHVFLNQLCYYSLQSAILSPSNTLSTVWLSSAAYLPSSTDPAIVVCVAFEMIRSLNFFDLGGVTSFVPTLNFLLNCVKNATPTFLIKFSGLFWVGVSLLFSSFVPIYGAGLAFMSEYISTIIHLLSTSSVFRDAILAQTPTGMLTPYTGLIPLLTRGLFHDETRDAAMTLITLMSTVSPVCNSLIYPYANIDQAGATVSTILLMVPFLAASLESFTAFARLASLSTTTLTSTKNAPTLVDLMRSQSDKLKSDDSRRLDSSTMKFIGSSASSVANLSVTLRRYAQSVAPQFTPELNNHFTTSSELAMDELQKNGPADSVLVWPSNDTDILHNDNIPFNEQRIAVVAQFEKSREIAQTLALACVIHKLPHVAIVLARYARCAYDSSSHFLDAIVQTTVPFIIDTPIETYVTHCLLRLLFGNTDYNLVRALLELFLTMIVTNDVVESRKSPQSDSGNKIQSAIADAFAFSFPDSPMSGYSERTLPLPSRKQTVVNMLIKEYRKKNPPRRSLLLLIHPRFSTLLLSALSKLNDSPLKMESSRLQTALLVFGTDRQLPLVDLGTLEFPPTRPQQFLDLMPYLLDSAITTPCGSVSELPSVMLNCMFTQLTEGLKEDLPLDDPANTQETSPQIPNDPSPATTPFLAPANSGKANTALTTFIGYTMNPTFTATEANRTNEFSYTSDYGATVKGKLNEYFHNLLYNSVDSPSFCQFDKEDEDQSRKDTLSTACLCAMLSTIPSFPNVNSSSQVSSANDSERIALMGLLDGWIGMSSPDTMAQITKDCQQLHSDNDTAAQRQALLNRKQAHYLGSAFSTQCIDGLDLVFTSFAMYQSLGTTVGKMLKEEFGPELVDMGRFVSLMSSSQNRTFHIRHEQTQSSAHLGLLSGLSEGQMETPPSGESSPSAGSPPTKGNPETITLQENNQKLSKMKSLSVADGFRRWFCMYLFNFPGIPSQNLGLIGAEQLKPLDSRSESINASPRPLSHQGIHTLNWQTFDEMLNAHGVKSFPARVEKRLQKQMGVAWDEYIMRAWKAVDVLVEYPLTEALVLFTDLPDMSTMNVTGEIDPELYKEKKKESDAEIEIQMPSFHERSDSRSSDDNDEESGEESVRSFRSDELMLTPVAQSLQGDEPFKMFPISPSGSKLSHESPKVDNEEQNLFHFGDREEESQSEWESETESTSEASEETETEEETIEDTPTPLNPQDTTAPIAHDSVQSQDLPILQIPDEPNETSGTI
ncbi:putative Cell morphogenesis N-terminal [Blattamonas nauphoetae]|uniref:Cell morphogenesis N-terminal n=1 Tax=Blattamonas nauphoetae TaxID=2049346 RepID=A0ABQ9YHZ4_9EUKA|nr:putative Cell morphogenesis N-terminal [Blattamonas nauphoetae]